MLAVSFTLAGCGARVTAKHAQGTAQRGIVVNGSDYTLPLTNADLQQWFDHANQAYFHGGLPRATRVRWGEPPLPDFMGFTEDAGDHYVILVSPRWNPAGQEARITVLHESCHVLAKAVHATDVGLDGHHGEFLRCEHRLQDAHALDGLM